MVALVLAIVAMGFMFGAIFAMILDDSFWEDDETSN